MCFYVRYDIIYTSLCYVKGHSSFFHKASVLMNNIIVKVSGHSA